MTGRAHGCGHAGREGRRARSNGGVMSRIHRLTTAAGTTLAVAALVAGPASAQQDLRSPDTRDAAAGRYPAVVHQDLRSPDARDAAEGRYPAASPELRQDLRSPDARDAAEHRTPVIVRVERSG